MLQLPSAWTLEAELSSEIGIPELWDTSIPIISRAYTKGVCSSLPHYGLRETISVAGRCIEPYYFAVKPYGLGQGSRSRLRLTSQDFGT